MIKIICLGKIKENYFNLAIEEYKKILNKLKGYKVYTVGEFYKNKNNYKTKEELIRKLKKINLKNKVILVKASRKMEFEKIVDFIKKELANN